MHAVMMVQGPISTKFGRKLRSEEGLAGLSGAVQGVPYVDGVVSLR